MAFSSSDSVVEAITSTDLTLPVRSALDSADAEVAGWQTEVLQGGAGFIGSVYRVTGTAADHGECVPWSVVFKVIRGDPSEASTDFGFWKREAAAYQSGALDALPAGVRAPRCHGCVVTDDSAWLWLEDVRDDLGSEWSLDQYGLVARHLGRLSGTYGPDHELLGQPWLSAGWLAAWVERVEPVMTSFRTAVERDVFARFFNARVTESVLQLWDARAALLDTLAQLPQTFCHFDAFRRNVIPSRHGNGDMQSVLLDWAFAGAGALGEELAPLTIASVLFDPAAKSDTLAELDDVAFHGYLDGLADVGWQGKPEDVRFVYATSAALRYLVGVTGFVISDTDDRGRFVGGSGWADPANQADAEALFGRPFDEIGDHFAGVFRWLAALGDEAFQLKP